jgi:MFS family permease
VNWWQIALLRFLVAMGVGGEWAVASAIVAEVFPQRARAWSLGIFHASSVLGTLLATAAGLIVAAGASWRIVFALGVLPALLTLWLRWQLREPEKWQQARDAGRQDAAQQLGRIGDLFARGLRRNTLVGVALAAIGMATFWGVHVNGKHLLRSAAERNRGRVLPTVVTGNRPTASIGKGEFVSNVKRAELIGMLLTTVGGGLGLISCGPLCERLGRRGTFLFFHLFGCVAGWIAFYAMPQAGLLALWIALPVFGFFTLGMHAGYAIYFPELFPTRLRGTGGGFCFNVGRIIAAPILVLAGWMQKDAGYTLEQTVTILSSLYLIGSVVLFFAPETKNKELPA